VFQCLTLFLHVLPFIIFYQDIRKRYIAERDPELHDFLQKIGDAALEIEALDTALECFEEESILRNKYGQQTEELADALHSFGSVLLDLGDNERALEAFLKEVDVRTKCLGPEDLSVAEVLDTIAALHLEGGDHMAALESFSQVVKIQKIHLGTDHEEVAETLYSIGLILLSLNDHEEALVAFREVVEIRQQTFGPMDEAVGDALNISGFLELKSGNKEQGLRLLSKALDIRRHNKEWSKAADTLQQIGDAHRESQNFDLAIDCYKECLKLSSKDQEGDEDEGIADGYIALGNIQTVVGQHADAGSSYQAALFIIMRVSDDEDDRVMPLLLKMGTSRLRAGDTDQAEQNLGQFVTLRRAREQNTDIDYVNALRIIGQIRMADGDETGAMEAWEEAFDTYTTHQLAYDHPRVGEKLRNLLDGADDEAAETGAGIAALFKTLRVRRNAGDNLEQTAEDIVNQATFFSTRDIDNWSFQPSSRSLMSSMRDTPSVRGGDGFSVTSRSISSRRSMYSHSRGRRSRDSTRHFFDERSVDGSLEQGLGRAYMR